MAASLCVWGGCCEKCNKETKEKYVSYLQVLLSNGDVDMQLACVGVLLEVLQRYWEDAKLVEQVCCSDLGFRSWCYIYFGYFLIALASHAFLNLSALQRYWEGAKLVEQACCSD